MNLENNIIHKTCIKCEVSKPISDFYKQNNTCRCCGKIQKQDYYQKNKKILRDKGKKHYLKNREKFLKYAKQYRDNNVEAVNSRIAKWRSKNKDKVNGYKKKWIMKNWQYVLELQRKRKKLKLKTDINYKIVENLRKRIWEVLNGNVKADHTIKLLGCSLEFFRKHLESKFQPGMNWDNYTYYGWHVDHIKPCAAFDLTKEEEQRKCFHWSNLQPLWMEDNLKKGKKYELSVPT